MKIQKIASVNDIFPGLGYDKYLDLTDEEKKELDNKVADTISKLQPLYSNAKELARHVRTLGMFTGELVRARGKKKSWNLEQFTYGEMPYSEKRLYRCGYTVGYGGTEDRWLCMLNAGHHFIILGFNERTGELVTVSLDTFIYDLDTGEELKSYPTLQDVMKLVSEE